MHLAYTVTGAGPPDLVLVEGYLTHLGIMWEHPAYRRWIDRLAGFARVIRFDKRGMGMSDRVQVGTLEQRMEDLHAVLDATGSERAALLGTSEGGPMSILFAATYPDRVSAVLLAGAEVKEEVNEDWPWGEWTREQFEADLATLPDRWGSVGMPPERYAPSLSDVEARRAFEWSQRLVREAASPGEAIAFKRMAFDIDVRSIAATLHVRTLVLHRRGDRVCPVENARFLAREISEVTYRELPGADHVAWWNPHGAEELAAEIQEFLTGTREPAQPDRILTTVLFSDVVDSTRELAEIGDARFRELVQLHHAAVRRELERFRGLEIDTAGDGFFAAFDGPARAIRCAEAIVNVVRSLGLQVRLGVHTGEVERVGDGLAGIAVHIGARVAALAGPGEILVTSTVHDIVAGSRIEFDPRAPVQLKGVPGQWRLFAVRGPS